jgi:hypothetical protein
MLGEATLDALGTFLGEAIRAHSRLSRYGKALAKYGVRA